MATLFKIDSKDKIRILEITVLDDCISREAGIYKGNLVETSKLSTPKNVGRSNETTGSEQAMLEAASEVSSKIDEGYVVISDHEKREEYDIRNYIKFHRVKTPKAMLAYPYNKDKVQYTS